MNLGEHGEGRNGNLGDKAQLSEDILGREVLRRTLTWSGDDLRDCGRESTLAKEIWEEIKDSCYGLKLKFPDRFMC